MTPKDVQDSINLRKMCTTCKKLKTLDCFRKSKTGRYGVNSLCRQCKKLWDMEHRNYERAMLLGREYYKLHKEEVLSRGKKYKKEMLKTSYGKLKHRAYCKYGYHRRLGHIEINPCEVCGKKAEAHHPDYTKPLEIRWLCSKHHKEVHREVHK